MAQDNPITEDDGSIDRFCRQYLQLERDLDYPPANLLREAHVQDTLYEQIFAKGALTYPPPKRYQLRILKELISKIEASIEDWDIYVRNSIFSPRREYFKCFELHIYVHFAM